MQDFLGGHINGAVNVSSDKFEDDDDVAHTIAEHLDGKDTVIVHCALSQVRGPFCAERCRRSISQMHRHISDANCGTECIICCLEMT